jgi:hypothetical protein
MSYELADGQSCLAAQASMRTRTTARDSPPATRYMLKDRIGSHPSRAATAADIPAERLKPRAPDSERDGRRQPRRERFLLAAAIALGLLVRLVPVLTHDFPLNDGALFYQMALEVKRAGFALPSVTGYNFDGIPFAYAPFGFYLAAFLGRTPEGILAAVRWIPPVVGCLMLPAFVLLARAILRKESLVIAATLAFALVPRSFLWIIMGGGLTRSLGMLFTILALWQAHALFTRRTWWRVLATAALTSLVVLSHLGTAPFLVASMGLFWLAFGRDRHGLLAAIAVGVLTLLFTAPWWATVVGEHGLAPFRAAQATGGSFLSGPAARWQVRIVLARLGLGTTGEPLFPIVLALGYLGALGEVTHRRFLLPAWWALVLFADIRAPGTYGSIPIAMLAGVAVTDVLIPMLLQWRAVQPRTHERTPFSWLTPRRWTTAVVGALVGYATFAVMIRTVSVPSELHMLTSLNAEDRAAMRWVATSTPRDSRVLVITGADWAADRVAEWFPVLAARKSVATVQGSEWLPGHEYDRRYAASEVLSKCAARDVGCVEQWAAANGKSFTHLYVAKTVGQGGLPGRDCCTGVLSTARNDPRYIRVYDGPGAEVFVRR